MTHYGLIEAGGTKFVLGVSDGEGRIGKTCRVPTTTPAETLTASIAWLLEQNLPLAAIGIAAFGPLELDPTSPGWGCIGATPKAHWSGADLVSPFAEAFGCPVAIDTDVNGAALAEARWGAGLGHGSLLYLTIGTGIGGGFVSQSRLLHGLTHPEMGHIRVPIHPDDNDFPGACPFHGTCLEGLTSGPAIERRWGTSLDKLGSDHPATAMAAWYIAQAVTSYRAVLQPARIVLGGGVMAAPGLLDAVRQQATALGNGYFPGDPAECIVSPGLRDRAGLMGALALALNSTS